MAKAKKDMIDAGDLPQGQKHEHAGNEHFSVCDLQSWI